MAISFYHAEQFEPRRLAPEEVDWRAKRIAEMLLKGQELQPVRVKSDDGYDVEVNHDTAGTNTNDVCPDMDCWWVHDKRDNSKWMIFRTEMEPEDFERIMGVIALHGINTATGEPMHDVEMVFRNRQLKDLAADTFPDDWVEQ